MKRLKPWIHTLSQPQNSWTIFGLFSVATIATVLYQNHHTGGITQIDPPQPGPAITQPAVPPVLTTDGVQFSSQLSQTKLVQGQNQTVYIDLKIKTPHQESGQDTRPSDLVVVLDRSGSMGADNRLPYAKKAIQTLMGMMKPNDRLSVVTFSDSGQILFPLTAINGDNRTRLTQLVESIYPTGGTDMSAGLMAAKSIASGKSNGLRQARIILLSDGEANQGIHSPAGLTQIVKEINSKAIVISTIGMGLGFNESLMSQLADFGGGGFSYLESLVSLDKLLARDLFQSRKVYATNSRVHLNLGDHVQIVDAGGYPMSRHGQKVTITTGQLLSGNERSFMITAQVPTQHLGSHQIASTQLEFGRLGSSRLQATESQGLKYQVVAVQKRQEAIASIKKGVYEKSWILNNVGRLKRKVARAIKSGNQAEAKAAISAFKAEADAAEKESGIVLQAPQVTRDLDALGAMADDAFTGSPSDQAVKKNRYSKRALSESIKQQRVVQSK